MNHPTSTTLSIPAYKTYTLDYTTLHPVPQQTFQHAVLLPNTAVPSGPQMQFTPAVSYHWDCSSWDEEFHIEHHRDNLRKVEDLLLQLLRIIHGDLHGN